MKRAVAVALLLVAVVAPVRAMQPSLPASGDARAAFDAAIDELCASPTDRTMQLPAGVYSFYSQPKPIACALTIVGQGKGATRLIRRYSGSYLLMWTRGTDQSGGGIRDLQLEAGAGTNGGIAIYLQAVADPDSSTNSLNRHSFTIDNILIGREAQGTSWDVGIYLDGTQNPVNSVGIAPGIRVTNITRTFVSGTNQASLYANDATGAYAQMDCGVPLNGSQAYVILRGAITDRFTLQSTMGCVPYWADNQARGLIFNNARVGPQ